MERRRPGPPRTITAMEQRHDRGLHTHAPTCPQSRPLMVRNSCCPQPTRPSRPNRAAHFRTPPRRGRGRHANPRPGIADRSAPSGTARRTRPGPSRTDDPASRRTRGRCFSRTLSGTSCPDSDDSASRRASSPAPVLHRDRVEKPCHPCIHRRDRSAFRPHGISTRRRLLPHHATLPRMPQAQPVATHRS